MPGIFGIISHRPAAECERELADMLGCLRHEPFYASGTFTAVDCGVYAGWVALENTFAAGQLFTNAERDVVLLWAGECFPEAGAAITSPSRAHWLVAEYEHHGPAFVGRLNGLFSGLLVDRRTGRAYLFNDRYGVERIYWTECADGIYFASEAKAILRVRHECRAFDMDGVADYINFGCVAGGRSLFHQVSLLPGGSCWMFTAKGCAKETYFTPVTWESQPTLRAPEFEEEFAEVLSSIVPRYARAPTRLGLSLTGGLDTRMIAACLPSERKDLVCFTYSGEKVDPLDVRLAARVATACGLEYHALRIKADFFQDFPALADRTVYLTDGCFGVTGAHEIYMSRQARSLAAQRLTGNYGGEVLRGVSTFRAAPPMMDLLHPDLRPRLAASAQRVAEWRHHQITFAAFREVPWNLYGNLQAGRSQIGFRTPYLDNRLVALAYRAPEALRRSRATALGFVRQRSSTLSAIPTDKADLGRHSGLGMLMRQAYARVTFKLDYLNNEGFPHWLTPLDAPCQKALASLGILGLHKHLHYRRWFREELADYLRQATAETVAQRNSLWDVAAVAKMVPDHINGRKNRVAELNLVLTLSAVQRLLLSASVTRPALIDRHYW